MSYLVNPYMVQASSASNRGVWCSHAGDLTYIETGTLGNAQTFGVTNVETMDGIATGGNATYGVAGGSYTGSLARWTFASTGSSVDWGDMDRPRQDTSGCSNDTLMVIAGGYASGSWHTWIDSVSIDGAGSASDFGDLTTAVYGGASLSSATRAVFAGGYNGGSLSGITTQAYITFASGGTATSAGSLIGSNNWMKTGCSNSTIGLWAGGYDEFDGIQKITIASLGTADDYGDLTNGFHKGGGLSSETVAVFGGDTSDEMCFKDFTDGGNCSVFGDLITPARMGGISDLVRT